MNISKHRIFPLLFVLAAIYMSLNPRHSVAAQAGSDTPFAYQLTLEDLGFQSDVLLSGQQSAFSMTFPNPNKHIETAMLMLYLQPAPGISDASTITINVNGRPVLVQPVTDLREGEPLEVPIADIDEEFIQIDIQSLLLTANEICQDSNHWIILGNQSALLFDRPDQYSSIRDFLLAPGGRIVFSGDWSTAEMQTHSIALYAAIQHAYHNVPVEIEMATGTPQLESTGLRIIQVTADQSDALLLKENTLFISADTNVFNVLENALADSVLLGDALSTLDVLSRAGHSDQLRTIRSLGVGNTNLVGTGELPVSIPFRITDFGGWPEQLTFHLRAAVDPIPEDTLDRALVRLRVNGSLVEAIDIRGTSVLDATIDIPSNLLKANNNLEVEFAYYPVEGNCSGNNYRLEATLLSNSAFSWQGIGDPTGNITEVSLYFAGKGDLIMDKLDPEVAQSIAEFLGTASRFAATPIRPIYAGTAPSENEASYKVLVNPTDAVAQEFGAVMALDRAFSIKTEQSDMMLMNATPSDAIGVIQYVPDKLQPVLIFQTSTEADASVLTSVLNRVSDPIAYNRLSGDLIIGDHDEFLNLTANADDIAISNGSSSFWSGDRANLRIVLFVAIAVLILFFWWQIYRQIGSKRNVAAPDQVDYISPTRD